MRTHTTALSLLAICLMTLTAYASSLPFGVKVGGQDAVLKSKDAAYSTIAKPVAADAELVVDAKADMIIVNVFPCDEKGNVKTGAQPAIILIQGGNTAKLNSTMDKKPLKPGRYIMNVVVTAKGTSRVMFQVKE